MKRISGFMGSFICCLLLACTLFLTGCGGQGTSGSAGVPAGPAGRRSYQMPLYHSWQYKKRIQRFAYFNTTPPILEIYFYTFSKHIFGTEMPRLPVSSLGF